jgi:photosystem II stability/assembly factor-like uncharacterized protein
MIDMNKKASIAAILLAVLLFGCGPYHNQPTNRNTPVSSTTLFSLSATNAITTETLTPTSILRLATVIRTPIPRAYLPPTMTPTPTYGPDDAEIEWLFPARMEIRDASFISLENGWALFDDYYLFQTKDGGLSWIELPRLKQAFRHIKFTNMERGWAIAQDGLYTTDNGGWKWERLMDAAFSFNNVRPVLTFVNKNLGFITLDTGLNRTTDGGKTWKVLNPEAFADLTRESWGISGISFTNEMTGWVLYRDCNMPGCRMKLFKTEDGGDTFSLVSEAGLGIDGSSMNWMRPGEEIFFLDDDHGWFVGNQYGFQWTTDGGKTWKSEGLSGLNSINHIHMFTLNDGITTGWDVTTGKYRGVMKTRDGGITWEPLLPSLQPDRLVRFLDTEHGFGLGGFLDPATLLRTENGGRSWEKIGELPEPVYQLQFLNAKIAWAGVSNFKNFFEDNQDYLWRTDDGGVTWKSILLPAGFRLQNFYFIHPENGIAWDYEKNAIQTLDSGKTWQQLNPDEPAIPLPVKDCNWIQTGTEIYHACSGSSGWNSVLKLNNINRFIPVYGSSAWVFGQKDAEGPMVLLRTVNSGETWEPIKTGRAGFQDLNFIDMDQGWALSGSSILKTTDGGNTWQQMPPATITSE